MGWNRTPTESDFKLIAFFLFLSTVFLHVPCLLGPVLRLQFGKCCPISLGRGRPKPKIVYLSRRHIARWPKHLVVWWCDNGSNGRFMCVSCAKYTSVVNNLWSQFQIEIHGPEQFLYILWSRVVVSALSFLLHWISNVFQLIGLIKLNAFGECDAG